MQNPEINVLAHLSRYLRGNVAIDLIQVEIKRNSSSMYM